MIPAAVFRRGQIVWVQVVECQAGGQLLVSYEGQLLSVKNSTGRNWMGGERLKLSVHSLHPTLEFRICSRENRSNGSLDRFV